MSAPMSGAPCMAIKWSMSIPAELWVSIDPAANYDTTAAAIQKVVDGYPGIQHDVQTYLKEQQQRCGSAGQTTRFVVRVYGDSMPTLRSTAEEVQTGH